MALCCLLFNTCCVNIGTLVNVGSVYTLWWRSHCNFISVGLQTWHCVVYYSIHVVWIFNIGTLVNVGSVYTLWWRSHCNYILVGLQTCLFYFYMYIGEQHVWLSKTNSVNFINTSTVIHTKSRMSATNLTANIYIYIYIYIPAFSDLNYSTKLMLAICQPWCVRACVRACARDAAVCAWFQLQDGRHAKAAKTRLETKGENGQCSPTTWTSSADMHIERIIIICMPEVHQR